MTDRELAHLFLGVALVRALAYSTLYVTRQMASPPSSSVYRSLALRSASHHDDAPDASEGGEERLIAALGKSATMEELAI